MSSDRQTRSRKDLCRVLTTQIKIRDYYEHHTKFAQSEVPEDENSKSTIRMIQVSYCFTTPFYVAFSHIYDGTFKRLIRVMAYLHFLGLSGSVGHSIRPYALPSPPIQYPFPLIVATMLQTGPAVCATELQTAGNKQPDPD